MRIKMKTCQKREPEKKKTGNRRGMKRANLLQVKRPRMAQISPRRKKGEKNGGASTSARSNSGARDHLVAAKRSSLGKLFEKGKNLGAAERVNQPRMFSPTFGPLPGGKKSRNVDVLPDGQAPIVGAVKGTTAKNPVIERCCRGGDENGSIHLGVRPALPIAQEVSSRHAKAVEKESRVEDSFWKGRGGEKAAWQQRSEKTPGTGGLALRRRVNEAKTESC